MSCWPLQALLDLRLLLEVVPDVGLLEMVLAMTDPAAGVLQGALPPLLLEPLRAFGAQDASGSGRLIIDNPLYSELLRVRFCASCLSREDSCSH